MDIKNGMVLWLTGESGSGKTTVANHLKEELSKTEKPIKILDGDELRKGISYNLGLLPEDRKEHNRRAAHLAKVIADIGGICIVSLICPYKESREIAKNIIGPDRFKLIYIHSTLEDRINRDPKGLYKKAINGEIKNLTGYDGYYDNPMITNEEYIFASTINSLAKETASHILIELKIDKLISSYLVK